MNPLELYLRRVARELRCMPVSKREDELRELLSHLEQRTQDFAAQGIDRAQAQMLAIEEFGAPRALGTKLCDAWECVPFSIGRLLLAVGGITLIWFSSLLALSFAFIGMRFWPQSVLFPELPYALVGTAIGLPFGCGWLFSHWLGRRGRLVTFLYFVFLAFGLKWSWNISTTFPIPFPMLSLMLATTGAFVGHALRRRRLYLASANGMLVPDSSLGTFNPRPLAFRLALALLIGVGLWVRVHTSLHPSTAQGVLRTFLFSHRGMNDYDFDIPTNLEMRELPATTPAELSGHEKRIKFRFKAHTTKEYAQRRVRYLQQQLAELPKDHDSLDEKPLRLSLARMKRNSQPIEGVALLVQTRDGWQVGENSFDFPQLWAWCYDIYYER